MKYFCIIFIFLLTACSPRLPMPEVFDEDQVLIEFSDLYQAGQIQFKAGIEARAELHHIWKTYNTEILLIMMTIEDEDGELERVQQSGVFVANGEYILTAAHGFYLDDSRLVDLKARTYNGQELDLEIVRLYYDKEHWKVQDWAILKPVNRFVTIGVHATTKNSLGAEVLVLGYPGSMGLNEDGRVVRANEVGGEEVLPLGIICERLLIKPQVLRPKVGAIPIRGISGAPILDEHGGLVGL